MHNESLADRQSDEPVKASKLDRIKTAALTTAIFAGPVVMGAGAMYVSTRNAKMALETAKLNLEAAKLNKS